MYELIVIGGGPAGMAAAVSAYDSGLEKVLIIERDRELGGILNQCIHNGFGLHTFKEELTGPEYAWRYECLVRERSIELMQDTMVIDLIPGEECHTVVTMSAQSGLQELHARSVILAMGCRERTAGAIGIAGDRPAGVFTAGAAQRYINLEGYNVGRRVVILGSGDIGLIMARRMTLEGAKVLACIEVMPYSSGLTRNIVQCLEDYDIPLYLSHTVTSVEAEDGRLSGVWVSKVDEKRKPIPGSEMHFECDTLLLSVGLIPENELSHQAGIRIEPSTGGPMVDEEMHTSVPGIFACGNVVHVHDLVDNVSAQSELAGKGAAAWVKGESERGSTIALRAGAGVSVVIPQRVNESSTQDVTVLFRSRSVFEACTVTVSSPDKVLLSTNRPFMVPGETQQLTLKRELLNSLTGDITVSCTERGEA